eukprot:TRINITY_DN73409_c0_g1_i1.p1 TRINITY_DN73409_c0_g1~~TRINITY_DN73409_c0_g1_i1.p1  ORF type:complete len:629 (+),score=194.12 TRINITY_DN73409_c0_g1_i1:79-1887(+)
MGKLQAEDDDLYSYSDSEPLPAKQPSARSRSPRRSDAKETKAAVKKSGSGAKDVKSSGDRKETSSSKKGKDDKDSKKLLKDVRDSTDKKGKESSSTKTSSKVASGTTAAKTSAKESSKGKDSKVDKEKDAKKSSKDKDKAASKKESDGAKASKAPAKSTAEKTAAVEKSSRGREKSPRRGRQSLPSPDPADRRVQRAAASRSRDQERRRKEDTDRREKEEKERREKDKRAAEKAREEAKARSRSRSARRGSNASVRARSSDSVGGASGSDSVSPSRRKGRNGAAAKPASADGFGAKLLDLRPPPADAPGGPKAAVMEVSGPAEFGPQAEPDASAAAASAVAVLPVQVQSLIESVPSLAREMAALKTSLALPGKPPVVQETASKPPALPKKEEPAETVLKMSRTLSAALLHIDNQPKLLARTGLISATPAQDGCIALHAHTKGGLEKALSALRRVAYHCQWGCNVKKVAQLLADKPAKPVSTVVVRLAATSNKMQSHESRLTAKAPKLRIGTQAGECQCVVEGVPGISRKHCTITLDVEKSACYVQDLSTNGTFLNGKRLPRPPYKHPQDARIRVFHGDELMFKLRSEDTEELGFIVNIELLG